MFKALGVGSVALVVSVLLVWRGTAAAQPATGNISGRVLWGSCVRIAIPLAPGAASGEAMPADGAQGQLPPEELTQEQLPPDVLPAPGIRRPTPQRALPAGAVLVAVQNTSISTRTDETGRFSLQGVPAGQYLTVAAGPVANSMSAIAERPNVFVNGGQDVQIGTLVLGGSSLGIVCRPFAPGTLEPETGELP
jgi:hypothetical protein